MKYRDHTYKWSKPFGEARHTWSLLGPIGAVHFHVSCSEKYGDTAGLEFHHVRASGYGVGEAPHHKDCWLTGEPCWHDGTSLYASDELWPKFKAMLANGDHDAIFRVLEREADERFDPMMMLDASVEGCGE